MGLFFIIMIGFMTVLSSFCKSESNVTITAWQYCQGCKITVDLYAHVAAKELKLLDKLPKNEKKVLDAAKVVDYLCDNSQLHSFRNFAKYSCIKVLDDDTRVKFLEEFAGSTSIPSLLNKKGIYEKKKKVTLPDDTKSMFMCFLIFLINNYLDMCRTY